MPPDVLSKILPGLIDCLVRREAVSISGYSQTEILQMLPKLNEHKLESIALLSLDGMSSLKDFYLSTYLTQFSVIQQRLRDVMNTMGCIFLQGFPRCLDFSDFYTPGMRSDIDIFVPAESIDAFKIAAFDAGFDYYGFDEADIFIVNQQQSEGLVAGNWSNKDVALTYLKAVDLPSDLPIEIADCYLPYIIRNGKTLLMVSVEVHHFYTDSSDVKILENRKECWEEMNAARCSIEATLYFNLVRLYKGVLAGEKRMRLLLDTACLLLRHRQPLDETILEEMIVSSNIKTEIISLCSALELIHPLFERIPNSHCCDSDIGITRNWLKAFNHSLTISSADEKK